MDYSEARKKAIEELKAELDYRSANGMKARANFDLMCDFCSAVKKRWEIKQVGPEYAEYTSSEFLKNASVLLSCEDCIEKYRMEVLKTEEAGIFDGQNEVLRGIYTSWKQSDFPNERNEDK
ncbi:MAG TPA: hypothetical protein VEY51_07885 [Chondromyces sp.]|nr:hypothetical protein [Chondromyces sp.]